MDNTAYQQVLSELEALPVEVGLHMIELLEVSTATAQLLSWLVRKNHFTVAELSAEMALSSYRSRRIIASLLCKDLIQAETTRPRYTYHVRVTQGRNLRTPGEVWKVFD